MKEYQLNTRDLLQVVHDRLVRVERLLKVQELRECLARHDRRPCGMEISVWSKQREVLCASINQLSSDIADDLGLPSPGSNCQ